MTPEAAREMLCLHLPQAVLLLGPGAWELGLGVGFVYGLQESVPVLDAETARRVRDEAQFTPPHPPLVYLIGLDRAGQPAQNMLLKLLEEPPSWTRFILAASREPLKTIVSRCHVMPLGAEPERQEGDSRVRGQVATAVRAARNGSQQLLSQALRGWSPEHSQVLQDWAYEAAAGRWRQFDDGFAPGVTPRQALSLLELLTRYSSSRLGSLVALSEAFSSQ